MVSTKNLTIGELSKMLSKKQMVIYVSERRRQIKQLVIEAFDSKCCVCDYNKIPGALEFHHINPEDKEFRISRMLTRSFKETVKELKKCVLVCANCHREIHSGITQIPVDAKKLPDDFEITKESITKIKLDK